MRLRLVVAAAIVVAGPAASLAQTARPVALTQGRGVAAELARGDTARYSVALGPRRFVYGEVDQRTVDVVVTVLGPDGRRLAEFDGPGAGEPEPFTFRSEEAGTYRILIAGFEGAAGRYAVSLRRVAPIATSPQARVDELMSPFTGTDRPGGVVAFVRDGEVVFARGYGMADLERGVPITPATVFQVASVSKQFTAFAVAMLADQGRVSLDDDVRRHLSWMPDLGSTITLRHLLSHTGGLRDQWHLWGMAGGLFEDVIRQQDLLRLIARQRELNFEPGREHLYSNTGYTILAEVVAAVTGRPFADWMRENVFAPLGMNATRFCDDYRRLVPDLAPSYRIGPGGVRRAVLSYSTVGATGLLTTAPDLARWLRNWRTGTVGGRGVLAEMQRRAILSGGDTVPYALGVEVGTWRGQRRLSHSGDDAGYRAFVAYFPALDAGVIVLGNSASLDPGAVAAGVSEAFLGRDLAPDTPAAEAPSSPADAAGEPWSPGAVDLAPFAGVYLSDELETVYTLTVAHGRLVARHRRHGDIPLTPVRPDLFAAGQWYFGWARFERDSTGATTAMRVSTPRARNVLFRRIR